MQSDGDFDFPNGTVLVKDIFPGADDGNPINGAAHMGAFYFTAQNYDRNYELWKSDGTESGTVLVRDIRPGASTSGPNDLISVNGTLFFTAGSDTQGRAFLGAGALGLGGLTLADLMRLRAESPRASRDKAVIRCA